MKTVYRGVFSVSNNDIHPSSLQLYPENQITQWRDMPGNLDTGNLNNLVLQLCQC